jgi:hypothetical protein
MNANKRKFKKTVIAFLSESFVFFVTKDVFK